MLRGGSRCLQPLNASRTIKLQTNSARAPPPEPGDPSKILIVGVLLPADCNVAVLVLIRLRITTKFLFGHLDYRSSLLDAVISDEFIIMWTWRYVRPMISIACFRVRDFTT